MLLASDGHPEADARRITQRPEHRHLVVAEEHRGVRPVTRVAEGADTEHPVINQVADEHRVPAVGWVGAERFEEPLEVAVDVPDEEDRQVLGSRPRAVEEGGHRTMLTLPSAARGVAQPGQSIGLQNRGPSYSTRWASPSNTGRSIATRPPGRSGKTSTASAFPCSGSAARES